MKKKGAEWLATSARSLPLRGRFRSGPRSVRPLRSVRSSAVALRLVRARASSPFVVRRSSFARRCSRRVPSGSPGRAAVRPRAFLRRPAAARRCAPSALSSSLLSPLSGSRAPLSPCAPPFLSLSAPRPLSAPPLSPAAPSLRGMRLHRQPLRALLFHIANIC